MVSGSERVRMQEIKIGVLAVQGAFAEHINCLQQLNFVYKKSAKNVKLDVVEIRSCDDVSQDMDALIIPGGESTTLNIFLSSGGFMESLKNWMASEDPDKKGGCRRKTIWGTCAGLIMLSNNITQQKAGGQIKFGGIDITTCRNFFGRQKQSFEQNLELHNSMLQLKGGGGAFNGIFIRAPGIVSVDNKPEVEVLATLLDNQPGDPDQDPIPVAVKQDNIMVTSFHPELTNDLRFHEFFVKLAIQNAKK